nr:transcriptional regulatory protein AlgP-like [Aegilops tauschii subsp. strangulata]
MAAASSSPPFPSSSPRRSSEEPAGHRSTTTSDLNHEGVALIHPSPSLRAAAASPCASPASSPSSRARGNRLLCSERLGHLLPRAPARIQPARSIRIGPRQQPPSSSARGARPRLLCCSKEPPPQSSPAAAAASPASSSRSGSSAPALTSASGHAAGKPCLRRLAKFRCRCLLHRAAPPQALISGLPCKFCCRLLPLVRD